MDFDKYQALTGETAIYGDEINELLGNIDCIAGEEFLEKVRMLLNISYVGLGLGESGEVQNKIKKIIRDSGGEITDDTRRAIVGELGGQLYYIARVCEHLGLSMSDVAEDNINILFDRKERGVIKGSGDDR